MRTQSSSAAHAPSVAELVPARIPFSTSTTIGRAPGRDREALIAAAAELFSRYGFKGTTLLEIASAASCRVSTIRREFGGKGKLLECVLRSVVSEKGPALSTGPFQRSLREEISRLVEWEARRMKQHRDYLASVLPEEDDHSEVTRIAGSVSFSSADVIAERLKRHRHVGESERQLLTYAIQSAGFAIGFVQADSAEPARVQVRIKQLAAILADCIERNDTMSGALQFLVPSLLPV